MFTKLHEAATIPAKAAPHSAGYDLYCLEDAIIPSRATATGMSRIRTGICAVIPTGYYGRVAPRSGYAINCSLQIGAGVIDSDYRGEIIVIAYLTHGTHDFRLVAGQKIAQLIVEKIYTGPEPLGDIVPHAGFGSTGDF